MSNKGGIPALIGPDDHHAYITYCPQQDMSTRGDEYTPTDFDVATKTTAELEKKGVKCILRGRDFSTKKNELMNVKDSIDRSKKTISIISKNYLGNSWFKDDTDYALKKLRARNQMASFIGIIVDVEEAEIPANLVNLHLLKFDDPQIWEKLYKLVTSDMQPQMDQQPVGESDIASALAWPYYYGYLNLILPNMDGRIKESGQWSVDRDRRTMPLKLFIIIPESCYSPPSFAKLDPKIEDHGWVTCSASRAGNPHRDYKNSIHKIQDQDGKYYYFVGEFATPILSLYEMAHGNMCGVTPGDMFHHLSLFYYTLENIMKLNPEYKDKVAVVYYRDLAENREPLSKVLLRRIKDEISEEVNLEKMERMGVRDINGATSSAAQVDIVNQDPNFPTSIPSEGTGYVGLYDINLIPAYNMIHKPRGLALIISNYKFTSNGCRALDDRTGTQHDEETLTRLFKDFNFHVDVHRDCTADKMETVLLDAARKDHSQYDAFVCCILTHGDLGIVYGSDSRSLEITGLTEFFKTCTTLFDKPKAFFIQACQTAQQAPAQARGGGDGIVDAQPGVLLPDAGVVELPTYMQYRSTHVPGARDFLMSYSTLPGHLSYRISDQGSVYVLALNQNLRKYRNMMDIDKILKIVTQEVREQVRCIDPAFTDTQVPFHLSTMQNLLYFK